MPVYTCKLEVKNQEDVVYHDIFDVPRKGSIAVSDLNKKLLQRFNIWIGNDRLNERDDLELLGLCLYDLLLPPTSNIRQEFERNYDFVTRKDMPGSRLRLTLVFHKEAGEIGNYPWEFLFMPPRWTNNGENSNGFFLAGQKTELILARFMPDVEHRLGAVEKELRILIVFSNPDDRVSPLDDLNTKETRDAIKMIEDLEQPDSHVRVKSLKNPSYEDLKKAINQSEGDGAFRPHIVHFIGHGDRREGLALSMSAADCEARKEAKLPPKAFWCDGKTFCDLFVDDPPPRLVFLHACEGARPEAFDSFSDLARQLASAKIPAVIAMQYAIRPDHAAAFAKVFYQELSAGKDVDEAVRKGRADLGLPINGGRGSWSDRRFGTPLVYLQTEKPIIEMPPPKSERRYDPDKRIPCPNPQCKTGKPLPTDRFCVECGHEITLCSQCLDKGECHFIDVEKGICSSCGFGRRVVVPLSVAGMTSIEPTPPATSSNASAAAGSGVASEPSPEKQSTSASAATAGPDASEFKPALKDNRT